MKKAPIICKSVSYLLGSILVVIIIAGRSHEHEIRPHDHEIPPHEHAHDYEILPHEHEVIAADTPAEIVSISEPNIYIRGTHE